MIDLGRFLIIVGDGGLTYLDLLLLIFCPIGAVIGTYVAGIMEYKQLAKEVPEQWFETRKAVITEYEVPEESTRMRIHDEYRSFIDQQYSLSRRGNGLIGFALGLVIALYFVGAITQDITSLARIFALSILLGYQAPNIWKAQEKAIGNIVDKKLQGLLSQVITKKNT